MAGLYLHIPFCEHKCVYCDFYSIESLDPMDDFVAALRTEIGMYAFQNDEPFDTIFFGGGTPSLLAPRTVGRIVELLASTFTVSVDAEVTLEANPGTVDEAKLRELRRAGVNRVSFGVQSFHDDDLKFLTRIHDAAQARQAVAMARAAGFDNVSLDLIFSLPGQTPERWEANLREALSLSVDHLSCYSLIVEQGTPLHRMVESRQVTTLPVEDDARLFERTAEVLAAAGYEQYEVSNFALPGRRSRHNLGYWNHSNYLGFGPSAHSFWGERRWWNVANLRTYLEKVGAGLAPLAGEEELGPSQLLDEAVMLGLRSTGIDFALLAERHGVDLRAANAAEIARLVSDGSATLVGNEFRLSPKGYLLADEISGAFLARAVRR